MPDLREDIQSALATCAKGSLSGSAKALFNTLGYESERTVSWDLDAFLKIGSTSTKPFTAKEQTELRRLKSLHLIFQIGDQELSKHGDLFDSSNTIDAQRIQSYIFFAADLPHGTYNRGELTTIARLINKPLPMPAIVLFRHGEKDEPLVSIAIIRRRLNKRDSSKDVLDKATLIKDIRCADPIRAHLEILNDFSLARLRDDEEIPNFVKLHAAWEKKLDSYSLCSSFYREVADWYFWAHHQVDDGTIRLPLHCDTEQEKSIFLIRLLTRVIFCWFLVEKRLIPARLFRWKHLTALLKDLAPQASSFYRGVLQNLFFGTLNMPPEQRGFREKKKEGERYDPERGATNLWHYGELFGDYDNKTNSSLSWNAFATQVPFLNGGLFDCLDDKIHKRKNNFILDGFSDNPRESCHLPNDLFFGHERTVDLSKDYGEEDKRTARSKKAKVRGLMEILAHYKFTIEENTPLEEEIALDPELLGKVFENLLASYNEDTRTTARKALGAFYTPREIVSYMVDEALKSYLATQVPRCKQALDDLFSNKATLKEIKPDTREALIAAIGRVKILDPACGSGAFPMGALHRLVDLLQKLDSNNESWKRDRLADARHYRQLLEESGAAMEEFAACDTRITDIERSFDTRFHALDFARKLYLIENCIYGVDIQPIATQIAKLRFFISLVVDQNVEPNAPNLGVRPLPNLETRLVAADTLIPIEKAESDLLTGELDKLRAELAAIRHEHFNARRPADKHKWRDADEAKRGEIAALLEHNHALPHDTARMLAAWDPYDQNEYARFFDSEWMFGLPIGNVKIKGKAPATLLGNLALINEVGGQSELTDSIQHEVESGFDVIISNPPYRKERDSKVLFDKVASTQWGSTYKEGKMDYWFYFMHRSIDLVRANGTIVFITSRYWTESTGAGKLIRRLANEVTPLNVVDIGKLMVFDNVAGHHMIHVYRRSREEIPIMVKRLSDDLSGLFATKSGLTVDIFSRLSTDLFRQKNRVTLYASRLAISTKSKLGELFRVSQGVVQNPDKVNRKNAERFRLNQGDGVFVVSASELARISPSQAELRFIKPFYNEAEIHRFHASPTSTHLLYLTKKNCPSLGTLPNLQRHLAPFRPIMTERRETKNGTIEWFQLHWPRDASLFEGEHLVFPSMFTVPTATVFTEPAYVGIGSNVVIASRSDANLSFLACLLNSAVSVFWWQEHGKQRGAGYDVGVDRLRDFPLPDISPSQTNVKLLCRIGEVIGITDQLSEIGSTTATRDPLMLAYWERVLNGLVYELYFSEEVHGMGLHLFDLVEKAKLPDASALAEKDRLPRLRQKFEELHDGTHPLRIALDKLQTLDTVRIIEGKA